MWTCHAGQSTDLSFLDPINRADTPPKAIQLAAGELSLRVLETRRRLDAGLGRIQDTIQRARMDGKPGEARALPAPAICTLLLPAWGASRTPSSAPAWPASPVRPESPAPIICLLPRQSSPEAVLRSEACTLHLLYRPAGRHPHLLGVQIMGTGTCKETMSSTDCDVYEWAGDKDADGVYTNTEDIDCEVCKGDLHLWAVVSPAQPGKATCPEHVSALECPTDAMRLLYRCSPATASAQ